MSYTLVRDEDTGTAKRLENPSGETIWTPDGGWSVKDDDLLDAILDDSNFGQPQKDALKALVIGPDEVTE